MVEIFDDSERARRGAAREEEMAETWPVRPGMEVIGSDGRSIGQVKEVRRSDFLVSRSLARDIYVPYSACQALEGERVTLNVAAGGVADQGWATSGTNETW